MKTYNNLFREISSLKNLNRAYLKARKGKSKKYYVLKFEENLEYELKKLQEELLNHSYKPKPLKKFIIRDPKTRKIHASAFRDRVIHHAIVNPIEPIFERIFICDSFASRKDKGTHLALKRLQSFMYKVSRNGRLIKNAINNNQIEGYCLKTDIKSYFDNVDHEILIRILNKKIDDIEAIWLVYQVLKNFEGKEKGKGMPLGNLTSQFFANVYLNELDYFVKHELKVKYYIRYVDDFIILHRSKKRLEFYRKKIEEFVNKELNLNLHPDKTNILSLANGLDFLGYKIFYHYKLLKKRNIRKFLKCIKIYKEGLISKEKFLDFYNGWEGYAKWANTYKLRKKLILSSNQFLKH
jgi:retron-type reverse transcriptase